MIRFISEKDKAGETTSWFHSDFRPSRIGCYRTSSIYCTDYKGCISFWTYEYWNGESWEKVQGEDGRDYAQFSKRRGFVWCGLLANPSIGENFALAA